MVSFKLFILDEFCNGFDLFVKECLLERIKKIVELLEFLMMFFVIYYMEEIFFCFDNIILLCDGEIIYYGKIENFLIEEVF